MLNSSWKVRTAWQQGSEQNAKFPEKMRKLNFLVNESLVSNFSQNTRIRQNLNMRFPMSLLCLKQHRRRIIQSLLLKFCIHKLHIKRKLERH